MNKNINLIEILKNCPKKFELYSTIHGIVYFDGITKNKEYPIRLIDTDFIHFTKDGKYAIDKPDGECILFPSKEQRDWSKFTAPWYNNDKFDPKTLKPFDKVIVRNKYDDEWTCTLFSHFTNDPYTRFIYKTNEASYIYCIPYNDDTKHLVGTTDEAPNRYRYWED